MISNNRRDGMTHRRLPFGDDPAAPTAERIVEVIEKRVIALNAAEAQHSWIEAAPSKDCFSDDPNVLAAFVEHTVETDADAKRLLSHFLDCDRCSFAVSELLRAISATGHTCNEAPASTDSPHEAPNGQDDVLRRPTSESAWINWFENLGLRPNGPTVFPDLTVADRAWEFGHLLNHPDREKLLETICDACIERIQTLHLSRSILLVAFSDAMHAISIAIAAKMKEQAGAALDIHVVGVKRFHEPCLLSKSSVVKNKSVLIVTDVVHQGRLLHKLWEIVGDEHASDIHGLALVNQQYDGQFGDRLIYLGYEKRESRCRLGKLPETCRSLRYFNPVRGVSLQESPSDEEHNWDQSNIAEWIPFFERTGAFKKNLRIGKCTYPFAINVLTLLKDKQSRKYIEKRATDLFNTFDPKMRWAFVYPAPRARRAGRIASLLSGTTGWMHISLGEASDSNFMHICADAHRKLEETDAVVIVDAAIRTGDTLRSQVDLLRAAGKTNIVAFYVLDLRREMDRRVHEESIAVPVYSLCRIPLGFGPARSIKSILKRRYKELVQEIESADVGPASKNAVRLFCEKFVHRRKSGRAAPHTKTIQGADIEKELQKGSTQPSEIIEHVAKGNRNNVSLTGFFNADQLFENEDQARDARYAINNTASPAFTRDLALLFAAQGEYSWLTKNWLVLHEDFLTKRESQWEFLAGIAFDARSKNASGHQSLRAAFEQFRDTIREREMRKDRDRFLFESELEKPVFEERCDALLELLE